MHAKSSISLALALAILAPCAQPASDVNRDPSVSDYYFARGVQLPKEERERTFLASSDRANFTFFHGVENVDVQGGKLSFSMDGKTATLGWGNYMGRQTVADIADMGQQQIIVRLRLRQSAKRAQWTARFWRDGRRLDRTVTATAVGAEWQELSFKPLNIDGANPDGLELVIAGEAGAKVEIEWLKLIQPTHEGYCRFEFDLPKGKVWRAVANVGSGNERHWMGRNEIVSRLHVNGKVVPRPMSTHLYHTSPVDLTPFLRPGRNCVGFYGFRIGHSPFLYLQARIAMESGEVVEVASGQHWKFSPKAGKGWSEPGYDDSSWQAAKRGTGPWADARNAAYAMDIPAYSGRLVMRNPTRLDLLYSDTSNVVVDVEAPAGLRTSAAALHFALGRSDAQGKCESTADGVIKECNTLDGSLVYRVDLGRRPHGVYALALALVDGDGKVIEERTREPIVVLREMALKEVAGRSYLEGLDVELEDTIDFTDLKDPHPWHEAAAPARTYGPVAGKITQPRIVRSNGLTYREVANPNRGSGFSYRFEFKHPGSFYYFEMEYPDDAQRVIEVSISSKTEGIWTNSQAGVGAETGGRFLNTGKMQTLRWLHVADPGPHSVDVINIVRGQNAAAKSLKIYRVKGDLPSVGAGRGRRYGIHTERCFYTSGIGMNFGVGMPKNRRDMLAADKKRPLMQTTLQDLVWQHETCERYVQYLKFTGQNCLVMGCIQYNEYNTPYMPRPVMDDARIVPCMKTMMANVLDMNRVDFYAGVEFCQSQDVRSYRNNAQVAKGADTIWMVDSNGKQWYGCGRRGFTIVPNWLHKSVRAKFNEHMTNLARTFGHLAAFRGVHGFTGPSQRAGYWVPAFGWASEYDKPLAASFDDVTVALFEQDTGVRLPLDKRDPKRFEKRAAFLSSAALRPRFMAWRAQKLAGYFDEAVRTLRRGRGDLEMVNVLAVEDSAFFQHLAASGRTFDEIMKGFGIDVAELDAVDGLWTGRWTLSWRSARPIATQDPYCWLSRTRPDVAAPFTHEDKRFVFVRTSWDENMFSTGGHAMKERRDHDRLVESDWIMNGCKIRALPQPGGFHCREGFTHAIITGDPRLLLGGFTDININVGHEQMLRGVLKPFTHLPPERFEPVLDTGLTTNVAIRMLHKGGRTWFYVANPCQWPVTAALSLSKGAVAELVSGKAASVARRNGSFLLRVPLEPFGLAAFVSSSPDLAVKGYAIEPLAGENLARLERIPGRVAALLADDEVRLSLAPKDRVFMTEQSTRVREAIAEREYALAWSRITHHRFWSLWQEFLEKAARSQARLPGRLGRTQRAAAPDGLPRVTMPRAQKPIAIDGRLTEPAWQHIPLAAGFWSAKGKPALAQTGFKVLFDDTALYLAVACADRDSAAVKATAKDEKGINAAGDDHVAVFLQPDATKPLYYQLAFNAKGVRFDQRVAGGHRDYAFAPAWSCATQIADGCWVTEAALPYRAFGLGKPPSAWRINVCRRFRNDDLPASSWSWAPRGWHDAERFGFLVQSGAER